MNELEANGFQIGVEVLNLHGGFPLLRRELPERGTGGLVRGLYLGERGKIIFSVQLLVIGLKPELAFRIPAAFQIPAGALPGHVKQFGGEPVFQRVCKSAVGQPCFGLGIGPFFRIIAGVKARKGAFQLPDERGSVKSEFFDRHINASFL